MSPFVVSFQSHVVSAFEHSLANMTSRLSKLTDEAESKVSVYEEEGERKIQMVAVIQFLEKQKLGETI